VRGGEDTADAGSGEGTADARNYSPRLASCCLEGRASPYVHSTVLGP
jgi:hypothetical protein